ncbi:hypothetical protein NDU88_004754, partial [Pleurodeles waltl]
MAGSLSSEAPRPSSIDGRGGTQTRCASERQSPFDGQSLKVKSGISSQDKDKEGPLCWASAARLQHHHTIQPGPSKPALTNISLVPLFFLHPDGNIEVGLLVSEAQLINLQPASSRPTRLFQLKTDATLDLLLDCCAPLMSHVPVMANALCFLLKIVVSGPLVGVSAWSCVPFGRQGKIKEREKNQRQ